VKVFHCDQCENLVFFENVTCVKCGRALAFLPDVVDVAALEPDQEGRWVSLAKASNRRQYRLCANYTQHSICNWAVPADDPDPLCRSCRLTQTIPELGVDNNREAWFRLEVAKRRLVYSLLELGLPLVSRAQDPINGLAFQFLGDAPNTGASAVLTGHDDGLITINIAEADDAEREKRRVALHEPYRTLLGHFRHEVGHYYWDRLIAGGPRLDAYRSMFGDEREDYAKALQKYYEHGAPSDWQDRFISAYASSHPWEDWAETWAHYLHMIDSLETAGNCGLSLQPPRGDEPSMPALSGDAPVLKLPFDELFDDWRTLTYALNNLNRSLGLQDSYPFVVPVAAIEKLRFVHETVLGSGKPAAPTEHHPPPDPEPAPVANAA